MSFRFRDKKSRHLLEQAVDFVAAAVAIAYRYKHDESRLPDEEEMRLFAKLDEELHRASTTVSYVRRRLEERLSGKGYSP